MTYIIELLAVVTFFFTLHYFTELRKKQKLYISFFLLAVVVGATLYNSYKSKEEQKLLDTVLKFKQHKTLICDGVKVNSTNYTLSIGTYTFIGKKNTQHANEMVSASICQ